MESKKINQLATNVAPQTSDLTIIGDPITGVSKKITLLQIANLFATTGTVTSVAVTETGDALTITGSPITSAGTINIGFAGDATQYVRGDGALADFPTSTGGGSSVSYYLNSSVSQGTIGGVAYRQLSKTPIIGAGTDITISANGYVANYITDANDPALLEVPGGNFNCEFYFSVNSNNHDPYVYAELYKYDGTTFTLLGSNQAIPDYLSNGTTLSAYYFAIPVAVAALTITDRLAIRIYVNVDGRTVTLHTENNHLCQVVTTFSKGLTSLNNLTRQVQFFGTGTSGTDFNISSSTATHTFNLPIASATNTGKLSSSDWSVFNAKQAALSFTAPLVNTSNTISIPAATSLVDGYLDNLDWVKFNTAYNDSIISAAVTGTTTKTLTLNQQDGGTITASWTDDNTDAVTSVFGRTGAVVAVSGDYNTSQVTENTNLYFTDARSRAALSFTAGSGAYNSTTGVITIPTNNNQITNGSNFITLTSLSAGTGISYNNTTGVITNSAPDQTVSLTAGAGISISGTYPSFTIASTITQYTDALARAAISLTTTGTSGAATYNSTTGVFNIPNYAPDLSGYVTLSTTQTITGVKTFTQNLSLDGNGSNAGTLLLKSNTALPTAIGYTSFNTTSNTIYLTTYVSNPKTAAFDLSGITDNTIRTFTLPNTNGTLALTSNLSAYLPLSGGTLTGALSGTSATFSGLVGIGTATPSSVYMLTLNGNASSTIGGISLRQNGTDTFYIGNPAIANTTDIELWNPRNGYIRFGTNNVETLRIASNGYLQLPKSRILGDSDICYIDLYNPASGNLSIVNTSANATYGNIIFSTSNTPRLTISSTGAATFTSAVIAQSLSISNGYYLSGRNAANTAFRTLLTFNSFNAIVIGQDSDIAAITLGANSETMRITPAGNVLIGKTSSTGGVLQVSNGTNMFNVDNDANGPYITAVNNANTVYKRLTIDASEILFDTSATERMKISSAGVVYIGNEFNDGQRLVVVHSNTTAYNPNGYNGINGLMTLDTGNATSAYATIRFAGGGSHEGLFGTVQTASGIAEFIWQNYNGSNYGEIMRLTGSRNLLLGTTSENSYGSARSLQINGSGGSLLETRYDGTSGVRVGSGSDHSYMHEPRNVEMRFATNDNTRFFIYGNGNYMFTGSNVSDRRAKDNIATLELTATDKIMQLEAKSYNMKNNPSQKRYGFIAQDVKEVVADLVCGNDKDGYLGLDYDGLLTLAIKALQEQQIEIQNLKQKLYEN